MGELKQIVQTIDNWEQDGQRLAMATVVSIKGSAYRRPGARMIISQNGNSLGMLGGGCFDADVIEKALQVIKTEVPQLHLYNMRDLDVWGLGLGCNGSAFILIESLSTETGREWIVNVKQSIKNRRSVTIEHQFSRSMEYTGGFRNGEVWIQRGYNLSGSQLNRNVFTNPSIFYEQIDPNPRLVIFGAGHDVIPVVELAAQSGFDVIVVDQRKELLNNSRFPNASLFVHSWPDDYTLNVKPLENDFVLFMSHNIYHDAEAFNFYRKHPVKYFGFLGPQRRAVQIMEDILKIDKYEIERISDIIYAPIGLDLGSETSEQVALSITAELMVVKNNRQPKLLRDKQGTIHSPQLSNLKIMSN
jgi:xanthine dehydrogenase accessory factor